MIKSIIISLGVGIISAILTKNNMDISNLNTYINVPKILFPIVWTILYILMGVSSFIVYKSNSKYRSDALIIYISQLAINFIWSLIFFNLKNYVLAFIWIIALLILIIIMIFYFYKINKLSSYLQIPYLLWVCFASVLTYQIYLLN